MAVSLAVALLTGCTDDQPGEPVATTTTTTVTSALAPCPQFPDADAPVVGGLPPAGFPCLGAGRDLSLSGPLGDVPMVLNLWATWCGPCRAELPLFQELYDEAAGQLLVVGLVERDTVDSSLAYAAELDLTFPSAIDESGELMTQLGRNALPITFFVGADGVVTHEQLRPVSSYAELAGLVAEHLDLTLT